jgi:hypothetical protein
MSEPQRLALAEIDRRHGELRLAAPPLLRQLRGSVQREAIPHPVVVSGAVEGERRVLLDGVKRALISTLIRDQNGPRIRSEPDRFLLRPQLCDSRTPNRSIARG